MRCGKKMKTLRLLWRDVRQGIVTKWYIFLIPALFSFVQTREFHAYLGKLVSQNVLYAQGTFADYLAYVMKGMAVFCFSPNDSFEIPIYWLAFYIGLAYMTAYYAYDDFLMNGRNMFIALRSRGKWWMSKLIYCCIAVIFYYAVCVGVIAVMAVYYNADMGWNVSASVMTYMYSSSAFSLDGKDVLLLTIILPMVITLAVSEVQMLLGFILTPVISFACVCAMYVFSAYYTVWYLVGNYTMWLRSAYIADEGVYPLSGFVFAAGMLAVACACGFMYFQNKDVV